MSALSPEAKGWVKLWRSYWVSPDFDPEPFTEREAFLWSVTQAAHSPHVQWFNGVQIPVERGEFATSSRKLAGAFQWSEKKARGFMQRMSKRGNWTLRAPQEGAHLATILSVCNFDRFQGLASQADAPEGAEQGEPRTHPGRTEDAQQNNSKNSENDNEGKKEGASARAPAQPYTEAIAAWSEIAAVKGWTPVAPSLPLSDKRRRGLGNILKVHGLDGWIATLQRAADSEWLGGPDPPVWFNLDFMCDPNKFPKVKDGNYDRAFSSNGPQQGVGSAWLAARDQLSNAI